MIADILSRPEVFWFALGLLLFLFELITPGFFIFFFGFGACITAVVCLIGEPGINMQIIIFAVISVLSLLGLRRMIRRKFFFNEDEKSKSIEDEFTGREAVAVTDFDGNNRGRVEFKGTQWKAEADMPVKTGQIVEITDKEGFILKVKFKK